jgi:hypothetical protein
MTRYEKPSTSVPKGLVKSGPPGPAQADVNRSTTSREGWGIGCSTLTKWWASATTATNSSDVTRRWRMTVDGC